MVDVSASKNPKGTNTKKDKEEMMPKTTFFSKVRRVSDTNNQHSEHGTVERHDSGNDGSGNQVLLR